MNLPDHIWQRLFYILVAIYGIVVLLTFSQYGITTDEPLHVAYGDHIARWYTSLFRDHTVFIASNLWLYGGVFDTLVYLLKQVVPMDVYELRHLICALVGIVGAIGAYRIGCLLGGTPAGMLAALFLILTPRYYGHAFNNTKDIPFAVGYLWSLYYLIRAVGVWPHLPREIIWKLGVVLGLTLGIRSSALLLVAYSGLFWGLRHLQYIGHHHFFQDWRKHLKKVAAICLIAYLTLFPFFPYLHLHPLTGLWDSLTAFSSFPEVHYNFFEARYIPSNVLPWYYIPKWLLLTLPEFVIPGLLIGLGCLAWVWIQIQWQKATVLQWALLAFSAAFPIAYGIVTHTPLLNGIRHLIFVVPPLIILSALSFSTLIHRITHMRIRQTVMAIFAGLTILVLSDMIALHPNQYVYFNRLFAGGLAEAALLYDTDYWNHTYKQGVRWIEHHAKPSEHKPIIGSLYKNVAFMVDKERFAFTQTDLYQADYYLGNTYFESHRAIAGEIIHTVEPMNVPLLYVIRPDSSYRSNAFFDQTALMHDFGGDTHRAKGDLEPALAAYEKTLQKLAGGFKRVGLDSSGVLHKMGNVLLGLDRYEAALATFDRIPDQETFAGSIANNIGLYFIGKKDYKQALLWLERAVSVAPNFYIASVSLGNLYLILQDTTQAIATYRQTAARHPEQSKAQLELGRLLYNVNQYEDALVCFQRMVDVRYQDAMGHYYLGLVHAAQKNYEAARQDFERTITFEPDYADAYHSLGAVCMYLKDFKAASKAYQKAIDFKPQIGNLHTMQGIAWMNLNRYDDAAKAFDRALQIDPGDITARNQRRFLRSVIGK